MEKTLGARLTELGVTMHELMMAFEKGLKEAEPGDEYAGNPTKWPTVRGIAAVTTMLLDAMDAKS